MNTFEKMSSSMDTVANHLVSMDMFVTDMLAAVKGGVPELSAVEACRVMHRLNQLHEVTDGIKKELGKVYDTSRMAWVPTKFEEEGIESTKIEGVGRVNLTSDINLQTPDKDMMYEWLHENGHSEIITETVNASTLKALVRKYIKDGKTVPDDVFVVKSFTRASITKA